MQHKHKMRTLSPQPSPHFSLRNFSNITTFSQMEKKKRSELKKMKLLTGSLLALAAIIFLSCLWLEKIYPNILAIKYVRAAAEAGLVGGCADWFAVTALFRYPFGLRIPHTAIIPRKKNQIGDALGDFIQEYFLTPEIVAEKITSLNLPIHAGEWLKDEEHSSELGQQVARIATYILGTIPDAEAEKIIQIHLIDRIAEPEWGPYAGRLLNYLLERNKHLPVIDVLLQRLYEWSLGSGELIDKVVNADMPKWAPKFVNSLLGYKIHHELVEFAQRVRDRPDHDMRQAINRLLYDFAQDLQYDPGIIEKVEKIKQEILARQEVRDLAQTIWAGSKKLAVEALDNPESPLRKKFIETAMDFGARLEHDQPLQQQINVRIDSITRMIVERYASQMVNIITETIQRWDTRDASKTIELNVGKDLQYIRINGTIVGALVGLLIFAVGQLLFP